MRYAIAEFKWDQDAHDYIIEATKNIDGIMDLDDKKITCPIRKKAVFEGPTNEELGLDHNCNECGEPKAKKGKTGDDGLVFVDGIMLDKEVIIACKKSLMNGPNDDGKQIIDALEAVEIFKAIADDDVVTRTERWTLRFILSSYRFTRAAHNFLVEALGRDKEKHSDEKGA